MITFSGGNDEKVTPVPIPNTAVKLLSADDTWLVTARKSKSLPDLYQSPVFIKAQGFVNAKSSKVRDCKVTKVRDGPLLYVFEKSVK